MIYTALMVIFTDFLAGVLSAIVIYGLVEKFVLGRRRAGYARQGERALAPSSELPAD